MAFLFTFLLYTFAIFLFTHISAQSPASGGTKILFFFGQTLTLIIGTNELFNWAKAIFDFDISISNTSSGGSSITESIECPFERNSYGKILTNLLQPISFLLILLILFFISLIVRAILYVRSRKVEKTQEQARMDQIFEQTISAEVIDQVKETITDEQEMNEVPVVVVNDAFIPQQESMHDESISQEQPVNDELIPQQESVTDEPILQQELVNNEITPQQESLNNEITPQQQSFNDEPIPQQESTNSAHSQVEQSQQETEVLAAQVETAVEVPTSSDALLEVPTTSTQMDETKEEKMNQHHKTQSISSSSQTPMIGEQQQSKSTPSQRQTPLSVLLWIGRLILAAVRKTFLTTEAYSASFISLLL